MQPGGKGRLTTKASNFSKELNEDLLRKVFGFRHVAGHSQAEGINPAIMPLIKLLEGAHVALSCSLRQRVIGFRLCLGFGCGHVFVFGANDESSLTPTVDTSRFRVFSKETTSSSAFPGTCEVLVALNAGVMQRFERVVALLNQKY